MRIPVIHINLRGVICPVLLIVAVSCSSVGKISTAGTGSSEPYQAYISRYADIAVDEMKKYGIPASITLAQGLLESDAGRSSLATKCNNHFGIKCHSDWKGPTMRHDDDARNECFRCYGSAAESFQDHSLFLVNGARYKSLFSLGPKDYEGWAKGLKAAGYATNPSYAVRLIDIIERYGLDRYDDVGSRTLAKGLVPHRQFTVNGVKCVRLEEGDRLRDIAREYQMSLSLLRRFNDLSRKFTPPAGSNIFLERKKYRADRNNESYVVSGDDSLWSISQKFGVRMGRLAGRNRIGQDNPLVTGMTLKLR